MKKIDGGEQNKDMPCVEWVQNESLSEGPE
jgi:hypothetical protein